MTRPHLDCIPEPNLEKYPAAVVLASFLVSVLESQRCAHAESVRRCNTFASHCWARLILRKTAADSAKFICWISRSMRSQLVSSMTDPFASTTTPVTSKLASTHSAILDPSTHQFSGTGSFWRSQFITPVTMFLLWSSDKTGGRTTQTTGDR